MRTRLFGILLVTGLTITACGGDDDGGGGSVQDQVADMMVDVINESMETEGLGDGISIDEDCVKDAAQDLSDDDAQAILDAGPDGDPDLSADAEDAAGALIDCVDIDLGEIDLDE